MTENIENILRGHDHTQSGCMDLTKEQTRMLVLLYEQHPCLYVQKSEDYHNRDKRLKALQTIAQRFHEIAGCTVSTEIIKKKIASLRTQYLEQMNKIQKSKSSGAGTDDVYKPTWWLFEELNFLAPHVASRKGESSIPKSIVAKLYVDTLSSQDCEAKNVDDDLLFVDVQRVVGSSSHNIPKEDFCNSSTSIKTASTSAMFTPQYNINKTQEMFETQSKHSETSSASSSSKSFHKRKKTELNDNSEAFWTNVNAVLKDINKDHDDHEDDGIHHWLLFLKSELKYIKDRRRLRRVQANILNLVQEALDADNTTQDYSQ